MRIAQLCVVPNRGPINELIERFPLLRRFPVEQARLGHQVLFGCPSDRASTCECEGVRFVSWDGRSRANALLGALNWIRSLKPDCVHFHGIIANHGVVCLALRASMPGVLLALQDQATFWPRSSVGRLLVRSALLTADRTFFAADALAEPFIASGALARDRVRRMPGGSTDFEMLPREVARERSGLSGEPLFLWAGRLAEVKAPVVAARALRRVLERKPAARLALAYGDAPLLEQVRAELKAVEQKVRWLGRVPNPQMPEIYGSADVFVSSSLREGYSFALIEAMACGASPVVSAIPASLQAIGDVGHSFPVGDEDALVEALERPATPRTLVRDHFERKLTYRAMAEASLAGYR